MHWDGHPLTKAIFIFMVTEAARHLQRQDHIPIPAQAAARPPHTLPRRGLPRRICRG